MTQALTILQEGLFWIGLAASGLLVGALWVEWLERHHRQVLLATLAVLSAHIVVRWVLTGHPPLFGTFENVVSAAWFVLVAAYFGRHWLAARSLPADFEGCFSLLVPALLAVGAFSERAPVASSATLSGALLYGHVFFAWLAHTLLLAASVAALLVLVRRSGWGGESVDGFMRRGIGAGFVFLTSMVLAGSTYSWVLFGEWYLWEIAEAFSAAAWLAYSALLHAVMFFRWRGRTLAWGVVAALPLLLGAFWVWSLYSGTYHHFSIPAVR